MNGTKWYLGFFSRQYKIPPQNFTDDIPPKPDPDCPKLGWAKKPLPKSISKHITQSLGFDLLYAGSGLFWTIILILSVLKQFRIL